MTTYEIIYDFSNDYTDECNISESSKGSGMAYYYEYKDYENWRKGLKTPFAKGNI